MTLTKAHERLQRLLRIFSEPEHAQANKSIQKARNGATAALSIGFFLRIFDKKFEPERAQANKSTKNARNGATAALCIGFSSNIL